MSVLAKLWPLAFRIRFDADGNYTFHAPSWIRFAAHLKDFKSTGITDEATANRVTVKDDAIVTALPIASALGILADRPPHSVGAGNALYYFATDQGTNGALLISDGAQWIEQISGAIVP